MLQIQAGPRLEVGLSFVGVLVKALILSLTADPWALENIQLPSTCQWWLDELHWHAICRDSSLEIEMSYASNMLRPTIECRIQC